MTTAQFQLEEQKSSKSAERWRTLSGILILIIVGLLIGIIVLATEKNSGSSTSQNAQISKSKDSPKIKTFSLPNPTTSSAPPESDFSVCGEGPNPNNNVIELDEPDAPGPFHDLTKHEMRLLRKFLEKDADIQAVTMTDYSKVTINSSFAFMADLWPPKKEDALNFLDNSGNQPERQARVMMFRGDKNPPVVEELICGPLSNITSCTLLRAGNRRNPVEFTSRPFNNLEMEAVFEFILPKIDAEIGDILIESFGTSFKNCSNGPCFVLNPSPTASALTGNQNQRLIWFWALYNVPFRLLHPADFGFQLNWTDVNPENWTVRKVWYESQYFDGLEEFRNAYHKNGSTVEKAKLKRPVYSDDLFSTLKRKGTYSPPNAQRPPQLVEPDGKRYSIKGREAEYLGWKFNFRMSSFSGPQLFNVRFQGARIAYELSLSEIAAFYSGYAPLSQSTDYVDSGAMSSLGSKALVPGGDCPDSATFIPYSVWNQREEEPGQYDAVFCMFEHNNNYPLRRHLEYAKPDGYYGGMLDSVLTLRSILVVGNYDYIIDFIFHQNGALETRLMSTGYIQSNIYRDVERRYGVKIQESITGNLHHHMFHLKADLDVSGTSNRYETLNIQPEDSKLSWDKERNYGQTKYTPVLKKTELEALYHYDINKPKYHIVHNDDVKNTWGEKKAYSIHLSGMSKNLFPEGEGNEPVISWARNQIAVTQRKEDEFLSSSNYGMYDTLDPVVNFSRFYEDNETIVDQDLVFWLTLGLHHIPHTEDLPVTPTAGNHLTAMFLPNNFFDQCPSMGSRDAIFVGFKDQSDPSQGVTLERNGNSRDKCVLPRPTLEEDIEANPDRVLPSKREPPTN